jgi:FixJ family two-component response regulator
MQDIPQIAVVDDDESMREAIRSLLRSVGFKAEMFASAEEFWQSDYRQSTACLVLDVRMPRMSGFDLQRQLALTDCSIPLIFVTAHGAEEGRERALRAGAVAFLYKPFSDEVLLRAVDTALHSSRGGA